MDRAPIVNVVTVHLLFAEALRGFKSPIMFLLIAPLTFFLILIYGLNKFWNMLIITVSVGAAIARPDDDVNTLIQRGDHVMYKSKDAGRNCITEDI